MFDMKFWLVTVLALIVLLPLVLTHASFAEKGTFVDEVIAAPVIVTLYQEETRFVNRVPIVPIIQFSSFIDEFYGNLEEIRTIEK